MARRQSRTPKKARSGRPSRRGSTARANNGKPQRRRLDPAARKAELLRAAVSVFAKRGIGRATHAEIADEAGCSLATVFVYFPHRDDLVTAVLDEVETFYTQMTIIKDNRTAPALDVLRAKIDAFTDSVSTHAEHARVWLEWSTAVREEIWPRYVAFQERIIEHVGSVIERGKLERTIPLHADGDDAARLMIGAAHMLAQMKFSGHPEDKIDRFVTTMTAVALGLAE